MSRSRGEEELTENAESKEPRKSSKGGPKEHQEPRQSRELRDIKDWREFRDPQDRKEHKRPSYRRHRSEISSTSAHKLESDSSQKETPLETPRGHGPGSTPGSYFDETPAAAERSRRQAEDPAARERRRAERHVAREAERGNSEGDRQHRSEQHERRRRRHSERQEVAKQIEVPEHRENRRERRQREREREGPQRHVEITDQPTFSFEAKEVHTEVTAAVPEPRQPSGQQARDGELDRHERRSERRSEPLVRQVREIAEKAETMKAHHWGLERPEYASRDRSESLEKQTTSQQITSLDDGHESLNYQLHNRFEPFEQQAPVQTALFEEPMAMRDAGQFYTAEAPHSRPQGYEQRPHRYSEPSLEPAASRENQKTQVRKVVELRQQPHEQLAYRSHYRSERFEEFKAYQASRATQAPAEMMEPQPQQLVGECPEPELQALPAYLVDGIEGPGPVDQAEYLLEGKAPPFKERKSKEVVFDLKPQEIEHSTRRSSRQRVSQSGRLQLRTMVDAPRAARPSVEVEVMAMPERRPLFVPKMPDAQLKSESPVYPEGDLYVPKRTSSQRQWGGAGRDLGVSDGARPRSLSRPRTADDSKPPPEDAARRARFERRRARERETEREEVIEPRSSGGLKGIFKKLFK
ncbi:hypothetical protein ESCO_005037 [Escovopsis weberi]|uniref:Uncharacterized protein n=1 Tax=Escovopsis weberi TaxID=150374 RepID=A0A0M9VW12_ESCWE|nr:hypothetical protein ESCO_005037 [Escovopsis weberi]